MFSAAYSHRVLKRILCFVVSLVLLVLPVSALPPAVNGSVALGISDAGTAQALTNALSDPLIGEIRINANIDASSINWNAVQKGGKIISGAGFTLTLPAMLSCSGSLELRDIKLVKSTPDGSVVFANSHQFKLGTGVVMDEAFIKAVFGGSDAAVSAGTDIVLESGMVGKIYAGANNGIINGDAKITVSQGVYVEAIYAAYSGNLINGSSILTLKGFGGQDSYSGAIPVATGFSNIVLDGCYIKLDTWPSWLDAGKLSLLNNSALWLNGSMAVSSRLHGENASLTIADGSVILLPSFIDAVTGSFNTVLSAGTGAGSVLLANGAPFAGNFNTAPESYHKAVSGNDLGIHYISLNRIEILPPLKTLYFTGEALDLSGGIIRSFYDPTPLGLSVDTPLSGGVITGYDNSRAGRQELTVSYMGKTAAFTVWVSDSNISRLSLFSLPKTRYYIGETLDIGGGYIELRYNNGNRTTIPFSDPSVEITGFDSSVSNNVLITVNYNGRLAGTYWITVRNYNYSDDNYYDEDIDLWGLPDNNKIELGDSFTVTPSYDGGRWVWDDDYFEVEIDRYDMTATFTAIKPGRSRIIYSEGGVRADEVIRITGTLDEPKPEELPEPPYDDYIPLSSRPQNGGGVIVPPAASITSPPPRPSSSTSEALSKVESAPKPEVESKAVVSSESPTVASEAAVPAQARVSPAINNDNLPIVVIGISAAILIAIVTGIFIWRATRKSESF